METVENIRKAIEILAAKINAPKYLLPEYDSTGDGTYIDIDRTGLLFYIGKDRGQEVFSEIALEINELAFYVFRGVTSSMAMDFEFSNRDPNVDIDSRRIMFQESERLMGILNPDWRNKIEKEHKNILKGYPFDDFSSARLKLYMQLKADGIANDSASRQADFKYPPPKPVR